MGKMEKASLHKQVGRLARRAAANVRLEDTFGVSYLLETLLGMGAQEQVITLADRAAAQVPLDNPRAVVLMINRMQAAGVQEQICKLLERDLATEVSIADQDAVEWLCKYCRKRAHSGKSPSWLSVLPPITL